MNLLENPFYLLGATPRDNRQRIHHLAEELVLVSESSDAAHSPAALTNPRKRLEAEVSWLLGVAPSRATELLAAVQRPSKAMLQLEGLPSLTYANLLATGLALFSERDAGDLAEWIQVLAWVFEQVDPSQVRLMINEERLVSGFPEVLDIDGIEEQLQARRLYFRKVCESVLNDLPSDSLVRTITEIVEFSTDDGDGDGHGPIFICPILIQDIVDSYKVHAQQFLELEAANIDILLASLRQALAAKRPDTTLATYLNQLERVIRNWDFVAQPIQIAARSRGHDHDESSRLAWRIRDLAILLFNEYDKLALSQQLTQLLQEVFAELGDVAERTAEDRGTLDGIQEQLRLYAAREKQQEEEFRKEISYSAEWGLIFKETVRISPEGIEWKGRRWDLASITRIRWGGTLHSVNGVPTGTTYKVFFGTSTNFGTIELKDSSVYGKLIQCLWRAVGVRLITEHLEKLRGGSRCSFGPTWIDDAGMELVRTRWLSANVPIYCRWRDLVVWNGAGSFCVAKKDEKKVVAIFSYQDHDNIHVLEAILRTKLERGGERLSDLLNS